ncbi:winged helix-turn-helix transcriptional regulator [Sediminibacterium ginsengisoli]|uniref:DNA-binding transcriptional regulator, HxlR family n=1 Tax=Sediminibacterium ginsengisoli TaxID=413434 RepID=A0A1T4P5G1_9BACT|nr:helix-turn-helix domain-containing protein [Sediminibacterium ginsengisoli]SJZ86679.1 DNA-binding transcriptional regulator, HxlR family [Sediminibacterium ginsengisoli]
MNQKIEKKPFPESCRVHLQAIDDTMDILNGKWKIRILGVLSFGTRRFMELQREVEGIGSKMLSKELKELEINELVKRTVYDTKPVTVEYEITEYGKTLHVIIGEIAKWGAQHRKRILRSGTVRKPVAA